MGLSAAYLAPKFDVVEQWKTTGQLVGYCMSGKYRGYRGDADSTSGSTKNHLAAAAAMLGWTPEVVMIGGGINASLAGVRQHILIHVPMFPFSGSTSYGSLHAAATTPATSTVTDGTGRTYQQVWASTVDALNAVGLNNGQVTLVVAWEGSGSNAWGGVGHVDAVTGVVGTAADYKAAFRNLVTYMRSYGLSTDVTIEWNVMTGGLSTSGLLNLYPGDDVVDICGWDGYAANRLGLSNRNNMQYLWDNDMKRDMDTMTAFAQAHGKVCGMSEMGMIQAVPGDTTSNAYVFHPADNNLYFKLLAAYCAAHPEWVYLSMFDENQPYNASLGTTDITEDDKLLYFLTSGNLSSQTYPRLFSTTSNGGTAYLTTSPQHTLSGPDWVNSMAAGKMQIPYASTTITTTASGLAVARKRLVVGSAY